MLNTLNTCNTLLFFTLSTYFMKHFMCSWSGGLFHIFGFWWTSLGINKVKIQLKYILLCISSAKVKKREYITTVLLITNDNQRTSSQKRDQWNLFHLMLLSSDSMTWTLVCPAETRKRDWTRISGGKKPDTGREGQTTCDWTITAALLQNLPRTCLTPTGLMHPTLLTTTDKLQMHLWFRGSWGD